MISGIWSWGWFLVLALDIHFNTWHWVGTVSLKGRPSFMNYDMSNFHLVYSPCLGIEDDFCNAKLFYLEMPFPNAPTPAMKIVKESYRHVLAVSSIRTDLS